MFEQATALNHIADHPAVRAWREIRPLGIMPGDVEALKDRKSSRVYRLSGAGPGASNVIAKRCPRQCGLAERVIYEKALPRLPFPTLQYYGMLEEEGSEFCWVFIEDAGGVRYCPDAEEHGVLAAEWLGRLHTTGAEFAAGLRLPDLGPRQYWQCLHSSGDRIQSNLNNPALKHEDRAVLSAIVTQCEIVEQRWSQIEESCAGMPRTLVHSDCHEANLRVTTTQAETVIVAFDWEAAGWDTPAVDLALAGLHIPTYWSLVRKVWPTVEMQTLRRLAKVGKIFQLLAMIEWESKGLVSQWRWKLMKHMQYYQSEMQLALEAAGLR